MVPRVHGMTAGSAIAGAAGNNHSSTARSVLSAPQTSRGDHHFMDDTVVEDRSKGFRSTVGSEMSASSNTSFLDASNSRGFKSRKGRRSRRGRRGILEDRNKVMDQEDKAQTKDSDSGWIGREKDIADGGPVKLNKSSEMAASALTASKDESIDVEKSFTQKSSWGGMHTPKLLGKNNKKKKGPMVIDDIRPDDAADAGDPGKAKEYVDDGDLELTVCCGPRTLWHRRTIAAGFDNLIRIAEPDAESKRIVKLGVPLTLAEIAECLFDSVTVIFISQNMGTDDLAAYTITALMIGLTDELIGGIIDAEHTVCTHAYGAGLNTLCGQYVQLGAGIYTIVSIPFFIMWVFLMRPCVLFLGLSQSIATRAEDYTRVVVFHYILEGIADAYGVLLEITGHEIFGTICDISEGVIDCLAVGLLVTLNKNATLIHVAFVHLAIGLIFFLFFLTVCLVKGWLNPFWKGMFRTNAFKVSLTNRTLESCLISHSDLTVTYHLFKLTEYTCVEELYLDGCTTFHWIIFGVWRGK